MKRSNLEWLADLKSSGPEQEKALEDLRAIIMTGLPFALGRYLSPSDPNFESLAEETAQETLLRVLDRLDTFQGRSQFTTWVHKIAIRIGLTELRRRKWRDVSLNGLLEDKPSSTTIKLLADQESRPERSTLQVDMIEMVERMINEELTEKQRQAIIAINIQGLPMSEVAQQMNTNRNALYKLLHDARIRLKKRLASEGLTPDDVLAAFER